MPCSSIRLTNSEFWILNLCLFFSLSWNFFITKILIKIDKKYWCNRVLCMKSQSEKKDWTKFDKTGYRRTILVSSSPNMIHKKFLSDTQIAICPEIKMTTLWWQTSLRHFTPTVKKMWQKSSFVESTLEPNTFLSYIVEFWMKIQACFSIKLIFYFYLNEIKVA